MISVRRNNAFINSVPDPRLSTATTRRSRPPRQRSRRESATVARPQPPSPARPQGAKSGFSFLPRSRWSAGEQQQRPRRRRGGHGRRQGGERHPKARPGRRRWAGEGTRQANERRGAQNHRTIPKKCADPRWDAVDGHSPSAAANRLPHSPGGLPPSPGGLPPAPLCRVSPPALWRPSVWRLRRPFDGLRAGGGAPGIRHVPDPAAHGRTAPDGRFSSPPARLQPRGAGAVGHAGRGAAAGGWFLPWRAPASGGGAGEGRLVGCPVDLMGQF